MTETEYIAALDAVAKIVWLHNFFKKLTKKRNNTNVRR